MTRSRPSDVDRPSIEPQAIVSTRVWLCTATRCGYNDGLRCRAASVRMESQGRQCSTFTVSRRRPVDTSSAGLVVSCEAAECAFNANKQCLALAVNMAAADGVAHCGLFRTVQENSSLEWRRNHRKQSYA